MRLSKLFQPPADLPFSEAEKTRYQAASAPVIYSGGDDVGLRVTVRGHGETLPTHAIRFAEEKYAPEVCKTVLLNTPESLRQDTDPNEFSFRSTMGKLDFNEQTGEFHSIIPTAKCNDGWVYCTSLAPKSEEGMHKLRNTFADRLADRRISVLEFAGWMGVDLSKKLSRTSKEPVHVQVVVGAVRYLNKLGRPRYLEGLAGADRIQLEESIFTKTDRFEPEQEVRFWFVPVGQQETLSPTQHKNIVVDVSPLALNCIHDDVDVMLELNWRRAQWEREFGFHGQPPCGSADHDPPANEGSCPSP